MFLESLEGVSGDIVLHTAGVSNGDLLRDADALEEGGEKLVALIHLDGDLAAGRSQADMLVFIHADVTVLSELLHEDRDGCSGISEIGADVSGADIVLLLGEDENGF